MNIFSIVLLLCLSIAHTEFAHAHIGTLQEVINAAKENKEPVYIKELMVHLSGKLWRFAQCSKIDDANQRLAWSLTMRTVVSVFAGMVVRDAARSAASSVAGALAWEAASDAVMSGPLGIAWNAVAWKVDNGRAWIVAYNIGGNAAFDAASRVARKAAQDAHRKGASDKEIGRVAYRAAEWRALKWLLDNVNRLSDKVYHAHLAAIGDSHKDNPFTNDNQIALFLDDPFGKLNCDAMLHLAPWLAQIVSVDQVAKKHRPLFQSMWPNAVPWREGTLILAGDPGSALSMLPHDVVKLILSALTDIGRVTQVHTRARQGICLDEEYR